LKTQVERGRLSSSIVVTDGRSWTRIWTTLVAVLAVALVAASCSTQEAVPPLERRAQQLNKVIMCPVCPGESIDQSQNELAVKMRAIVMEKLEQGWTEDQIKAYFVQGYGTSVLLEPPRKGFSLVVWILPPVGVLGAALALFMTMRLMRNPPAVQIQRLDEDLHLSKEERNEYFRRIQLALDREGGSDTPGREEGASGPENEGAG